MGRQLLAICLCALALLSGAFAIENSTFALSDGGASSLVEFKGKSSNFRIYTGGPTQFLEVWRWCVKGGVALGSKEQKESPGGSARPTACCALKIASFEPGST